jgi:hypothetical protein
MRTNEVRATAVFLKFWIFKLALIDMQLLSGILKFRHVEKEYGVRANYSEVKMENDESL